MRQVLAWLSLTIGVAALYLEHAFVACLFIVGWLVLLGDARITPMREI